MPETSKIMIVDDDRNICDLLQLYLQKDGYRLFFAHDGSQALDVFRQENPDLIILDIMLPNINGWDVCRLIRRHSNVPIIMLTARDSSEEKVSGLDMGADDYVIKPFDPKEVAARVRAHLRKQVPKEKSGYAVLTAGNLSLDMKKYEVLCDGMVISLTAKEMQLLNYLRENKNIVLRREQILKAVWGYDFPGETRTVDMHIKKLREKLAGNKGWTIRTVFGVGYKFEVSNV